MAETKPLFFIDLSILSGDELIRAGAIFYAILEAATVTVMGAASAQAIYIDEWQREGGLGSMNRLIYGLFNCSSGSEVEQAPLFGLVGNVIARITDCEYRCAGYRREWNNGRIYAEGNVDTYGLYHFMNGHYPIRPNSLMAVDRFITARPMEWGIVTPFPRTRLDVCWSTITVNNNTDARLFESGTMIITDSGG